MNFINNSQIYNIGDEGFMFALRLQNYVVNVDQVIIGFPQTTYENFQPFTVSVNIESCTREHFPSSIVNQIEDLGILNNYYCPNRTQIKLLKDFTYSNAITTGVAILLWDSINYSWDDINTIYNNYEGKDVSIYIVEGYYDSEDYNDPVKYAINKLYSSSLGLNHSTYKNIQLKRNIVNMIDGSTRVFYSTEK